MTKLDMLNAQRAEKFVALCALVARDLGYGELQHLSEEDRNHIEGEAKHYVALWGETLEIRAAGADGFAPNFSQWMRKRLRHAPRLAPINEFYPANLGTTKGRSSDGGETKDRPHPFAPRCLTTSLSSQRQQRSATRS